MATTAVGTITHDTTVAIMAVVIIQATTTGPTTGLSPAFTSAGAMVGGGIVAGMAAVGTTIVGTTMAGTGAVDGIITTDSGPSDRRDLSQRSVLHVRNWLARLFIGVMWWQQSLWKLPSHLHG
jgi:hypothetical protein